MWKTSAPKLRKRSKRSGAQTLPVRATGKAGGSKSQPTRQGLSFSRIKSRSSVALGLLAPERASPAEMRSAWIDILRTCSRTRLSSAAVLVPFWSLIVLHVLPTAGYPRRAS